MFIYRPYEQTDLNFVRKTWAMSYYYDNYLKNHLSIKQFHHYHRPIRERILAEPTLAVIICASEANPDQILGWIAAEVLEESKQMIIHYIYVKDLYRKEGIGKSLLEKVMHEKPVFYTHESIIGRAILKKMPRESFVYAPHLV